MFASFAILEIQKQVTGDYSAGPVYISVIIPISWIVGTCYKYYLVRKNSPVKFNLIYVILCIEYLLLIAYFWIPLLDLKYEVYCAVFVFGLIDTYIRNSLVRLVYLVDDEKRWILSATRSIAGIIGTLLQINQLSFIQDRHKDSGYSTGGSISRIFCTTLCLLILIMGLYQTFKLQKAPQSIYELSMCDQVDDVSETTI